MTEEIRTCRYCGYTDADPDHEQDWADDDECGECAEKIQAAMDRGENDLERRLADAIASTKMASSRIKELVEQSAESEEKLAVLTDRYHKLNAHAKALREERDKVEAACGAMRAALEAWEHWQGDVILDAKCWEAGPPKLTQSLFDRLLQEVLPLRHAVLSPGASRLAARPTLFRLGEVSLHSGGTSNFKIDCDALTDADWDCLAAIVAEHVVFGAVVGVPTGGLRWASALHAYGTSGPTLIVDDVLTTGASMEDARKRHPGAIGAVLFARGMCPDWVTPVFQMWPGRLAAEVLRTSDRYLAAQCREDGAPEDCEGAEDAWTAAVEAWRKGEHGGIPSSAIQKAHAAKFPIDDTIRDGITPG